VLDALIEYLANGNDWAAERLTREPGWVLDRTLHDSDGKLFAEHLTQIDDQDIAALKLGKTAEALYQQATELHRRLDRYSYAGPRIRFSKSEIDQARAAGVTIEFERSAPVIVDRALYRELVKQAIARTHNELEAQLAEHEAEQKARRATTRSQRDDPTYATRRQEKQQLRVVVEQAHGVNLDLGASLLNGLSTVDPADINVARFFVYALLGSGYDDSPYKQSGERIRRLAMSGIRLVIGEFRTHVTKTLKSGQRGLLRIDYGDPRQPNEAVKWLWKFVDGAKTAGELYGRGLVVIAASNTRRGSSSPRASARPPRDGARTRATRPKH
jgi:hypothetical protein